MHMDDDLRRRLVYGLISLVLSALAARLALYLTNKILGKPDEGRLLS
ncbi:MAG TPA: hypothetical protein VNL77_21070 [Roseiflexaceae bacterium]|nr:hypothetical protein [Roseiflexaceae bacterium]